MTAELQERKEWEQLEEALVEYAPHERVEVVSGKALGHYFVRFGTAFLIEEYDEETEDGGPAEKWKSIVEALREDSRVAWVGGEPATKEWSSYRPVLPTRSQTRENLLSGQDAQKNLRFSDNIFFKLQVPKKNQKTVYDWDDIPTDTYWVAWDGVSIVVLWECDEDVVFPPGGGGHIAFEVLSQTCKAVGMELMVQACSPGCQNMFAHTDIRAVQLPEKAEIHSTANMKTAPVAVAIRSVDGGALEVLADFAEDMSLAGREFSIMKNRARRLLDLESQARDIVAELLAADYARLERRANRKKWFGGATSRAARRPAEHRIASLWIAMAAIEVLRRDWSQARMRFIDAARLAGVGGYYDIDRKDDDKHVEDIKIDFIRAAVEQQSNRMDNAMVTRVTGASGVAAMVGAVVGALVGALAGGW